MRKLLGYILLSLLSVSCATKSSQQLSGTLVGMQLGSMVGRAVGFASGDYGSSLTGAAIGAVTGAALGNVINAPKSNETASREQISSTTSPAKDNSRQQRGREQIQQAVATASSASIPISIRNIQFGSDIDDNTLRRGKPAKLSFDIKNTSDETLALVEPLVECSNKNVELSSMVAIENIAAGEGVRYTVTLFAERLRNATATIIIKLSVDKGAYEVMGLHLISTEK